MYIFHNWLRTSADAVVISVRRRVRSAIIRTATIRTKSAKRLQ